MDKFALLEGNWTSSIDLDFSMNKRVALLYEGFQMLFLHEQLFVLVLLDHRGWIGVDNLYRSIQSNLPSRYEYTHS